MLFILARDIKIIKTIRLEMGERAWNARLKHFVRIPNGMHVTYRDTPSEEVAQNTVRRYFFAQLRSIFPTDVRQSPFFYSSFKKDRKKTNFTLDTNFSILKTLYGLCLFARHVQAICISTLGIFLSFIALVVFFIRHLA